MRSDPVLQDLFLGNASELVGRERVIVMEDRRNRGGSTDMGDVSHLMPVIHPYVGGAMGIGHGANYLIKDWQNVVLNAAKGMAFTVVDLLTEGAGHAQEIQARHKARMTKQEYLSFMRGLLNEESYEE